jgi:hypothetical protein
VQVEGFDGGFVVEVAGGVIMAFRPPKGVPPPQLQGKRTGRPKGSKTFASAWRDAKWGYDHRDDTAATPPNPAALLWMSFASWFPFEVREWLEARGQLVEEDRPSGLEGMFEDMCWVLEHEEQTDTTYARQNMRKFYTDQPNKFMTLLFRIERDLIKLGLR